MEAENKIQPPPQKKTLRAFHPKHFLLYNCHSVKCQRCRTIFHYGNWFFLEKDVYAYSNKYKLRMFDIYGLDKVTMYENQILGTLPPHLFAVGKRSRQKKLTFRLTTKNVRFFWMAPLWEHLRSTCSQRIYPLRPWSPSSITLQVDKKNCKIKVLDEHKVQEVWKNQIYSYNASTGGNTRKGFG